MTNLKPNDQIEQVIDDMSNDEPIRFVIKFEDGQSGRSSSLASNVDQNSFEFYIQFDGKVYTESRIK